MPASKEYVEGWKACEQTTGPDRPECPYAEGTTEWDEWDRGFRDSEFGWLEEIERV